MEAIGGIIASLLGVAAQAQAENDQKNLGYANLFETKRENREREKLAESSQTDAYGNKIYYDPLTRAWKIQSTPTTKNILDAEQSEQLKSLTSDAARNRSAAIRKDQRAQQANDLFTQALTDYKYRPQQSEADYVGDATKEALLSRRAGAAEAAAAVNKALIRAGNGSQIPAVFNAARDADANEFEQTLLGAKRQGEQDFLNIGGAKDQKAQQQIDFLRSIADDTSDSPIHFGNENDTLANRSSGALSQLLSVLAQDSANRQGAVGPLMDALGRSPDFSGLGSALGRLGSMGGQQTTSAYPSKTTPQGTIDGGWWQTMGQMGYLTPSSSSASAFMNEF
ncbi:MAG TPA: hypothetical protein VN039_12360 [Nitrospira sp.]|jgi:hypothetical protein|nr:hypothetical protein [Nitrospira sp.]